MICNTLTLALALALAATASAAAIQPRWTDPCMDTYNVCVAAGIPEVVCNCRLASCLGEDPVRIRDWCAIQTASLGNFPTPTPIPGGCNPAHPGSCPSSYFETSTAPAATFTSIPSTAPAPTFTSIPGIPGGCNPAHPGSCPSSYFQTTTQPATPTATDDCDDEPIAIATAAPAPAPAPAQGAPGSNPVLVPGKTWTIANLTRYCGADGFGCDYNFDIIANGKTERCTVIRKPGSNAATESWSNEVCTAGSDITISWGYVPEPAPAFVVITVNQGKELAWFGVADVNGAPVTPGAPFGSGNWTVPASPVYTYN